MKLNHMLQSKFEDLTDMDYLINKFRTSYKYSWGTTKNYIVLLGKFGDFAFTQKLFQAPSKWFETFKVHYKNAISGCSYHMRETDALRAREVSQERWFKQPYCPCVNICHFSISSAQNEMGLYKSQQKWCTKKLSLSNTNFNGGGCGKYITWPVVFESSCSWSKGEGMIYFTQYTV